MNEEAKKSNRTTIILVIVLFLSPLFLSWFVFNYTDYIEMRGTANRGELVTPPRPLEDYKLIDPLDIDRNDTLFGKWSLVYVSDTCDEQCMDNVYRMRQIHLTMDKHSLRVQKVLLLTSQKAEDLKDVLLEYRGQQFIDIEANDVNELIKQFKLNDADKPLQAGRLYIVDPLGNLILSYLPDANPRDIYKDLKKLLRASRVG
jgi:cytochrome oxidase Cu insertion factor (SCO1/SenC/PrrC family)